MNKYLKTLDKLLGNKNAFGLDESRGAFYLERYLWIAEQNGTKLAGVALPGTTEELQACVRFVAEGGFSIWSIPNAAGNGAMLGPSDKPVIILDLRRMNRILEVNADMVYALVEPGVSYRQLYEYIQEHNIPLWLDCDRNSNNSIAGSVYSRALGYTPYADHQRTQCGMEVVLANGELLRTGMGSLPGSNTWQLSKYAYGPFNDGLFTQSRLGIMSKVGLWLSPPPADYRPFMVTLPGLNDLGTAVEILRPMGITRTIPGTIMISHVTLEIAPYSRRETIARNGKIAIADIKDTWKLGIWNLYGALYGQARHIELAWTHIEKALRGIGDVGIYLHEDRKNDPVWQGREPLMWGAPGDVDMDLSGWGGHAQITLTVASTIEDVHAMKMYEIVNRLVAENGFDYLCEYALNGRSMIKRIYLPYEYNDRSRCDRAWKLSLKLAEDLSAAGFGVVNGNDVLGLTAHEQYNSNALAGLNKQLKRALDPHGVLA